MNEQSQRITNAETVRVMVTKALKAKGLLLNGFQYPLVGDLKYTIEVEAATPEQIGEIYEVIKRYADDIKARIKSADVHTTGTEWHMSKIVLTPYGSKA